MNQDTGIKELEREYQRAWDVRDLTKARAVNDVLYEAYYRIYKITQDLLSARKISNCYKGISKALEGVIKRLEKLQEEGVLLTEIENAKINQSNIQGGS